MFNLNGLVKNKINQSQQEAQVLFSQEQEEQSCLMEATS